MNKLKIEQRNTDKKIRLMRESGIIPGTMYGPNIDNTPIKVSETELKRALQKPGEVYQVKSKNRSVLVKFGEVQTHPVTNDFLHFSIVEMPRGEKSDIELPVDLKGTPIGVKKGGTLVVLKDEVTVSGMPKLMPEKLEANISQLDIGDKITVDNLKMPKKLETIDDDSEVIAVCQPPTKEIEVQAEETEESEYILNIPAQTV